MTEDSYLMFALNSDGRGGGIWQMLTIADEGGRGASQKLTIAEGGGGSRISADVICE